MGAAGRQLAEDAHVAGFRQFFCVQILLVHVVSNDKICVLVTLAKCPRLAADPLFCLISFILVLILAFFSSLLQTWSISGKQTLTTHIKVC
jgi:hypothetical protein